MPPALPVVALPRRASVPPFPVEQPGVAAAVTAMNFGRHWCFQAAVAAAQTTRDRAATAAVPRVAVAEVGGALGVWVASVGVEVMDLF